MWQILHASFWKFTKLSNSGISLNWFVTDEVTTRNTFLIHSVCSNLTSMRYKADRSQLSLTHYIRNKQVSLNATLSKCVPPPLYNIHTFVHCDLDI